MASLAVLFWWVVFGLVRWVFLGAAVAVAGPVWMVRRLDRARDAAEVEWLLACARRRVAARQRVRGFGQDAGQGRGL
jgi:hypothetical protein